MTQTFVWMQACRSTPDAKGKYIKIILALLQSPSAAVTYECAVTLTSLSQAPTAVRAAANCYCQLLVSQSDNNVKLIVLDRLQELKDKHRDVMQVGKSIIDIFLLTPGLFRFDGVTSASSYLELSMGLTS